MLMFSRCSALRLRTDNSRSATDLPITSGEIFSATTGAARVKLGFSPAEKLQWARPFVIANLLVFALMWGWLCEYVATALMYWRDRREVRA